VVPQGTRTSEPAVDVKIHQQRSSVFQSSSPFFERRHQGHHAAFDMLGLPCCPSSLPGVCRNPVRRTPPWRVPRENSEAILSAARGIYQTRLPGAARGPSRGRLDEIADWRMIVRRIVDISGGPTLVPGSPRGSCGRRIHPCGAIKVLDGCCLHLRLVAQSLAAAEQQAPDRKARRQQLLLQFDKNGDGKLDQQERQAIQQHVRARLATATAPAESDGLADARNEVYKKVDGVELKIHFFMPRTTRRRTSGRQIVFFFGGGWLSGSPGQFVPQCKYLASRGMVAATADYRVYTRHQAMIADCTADAQAAVRWVRAHAQELALTPTASPQAAGRPAATWLQRRGRSRTSRGDKDASVSFRPNAMVLFNPGDRSDARRVQGGRIGKQAPRHHVPAGCQARRAFAHGQRSPGVPPTIIFHGRQDQLIPFARIEEFGKAMKAAGNRCEVVGFEGQKHGFFNARTTVADTSSKPFAWPTDPDLSRLSER